MICPRCNSQASIVNDTHYVCNNASCVDDAGNRTQFQVIEDDHIHFPYDQIFGSTKPLNRFYYKKYLDIGIIGNSNIR